MSAAEREALWRRDIAHAWAAYSTASSAGGGSGVRVMTASRMKLAFIYCCGVKPSKFEILQLLRAVAPPAGAPSPLTADTKAAPSSSSSLPPASLPGGAVEGFTRPQFERVLLARLRVSDGDEVVRQTFDAFDSGFRGFLTPDDLRAALAAAGAPRMAAAVTASAAVAGAVDAAFAAVDADANGKVGYRDFHGLLTTPSAAAAASAAAAVPAYPTAKK